MRKDLYPRVIFFVGIDGSGKSAHAHAVETLLRSKGKNVKYVWMRRIAYCSIPLLGMCRVLGITKVRRFKDGSHWISEYPFYAYRPLQLLWPWLQLTDSLLHTLFYISLPLLFSSKTIVVVDRGIIDTLVDVTVDVGFPKGYTVLENLFVSAVPKDSCITVFDVDEAIAIQRKDDIPDIQYLKIRRKLYAELAKRCKWPIFSTEDNFSSVHKKVVSVIGSGCRC